MGKNFLKAIRYAKKRNRTLPHTMISRVVENPYKRNEYIVITEPSQMIQIRIKADMVRKKGFDIGRQYTY